MEPERVVTADRGPDMNLWVIAQATMNATKSSQSQG
jgi:hypothetical protein